MRHDTCAGKSKPRCMLVQAYLKGSARILHLSNRHPSGGRPLTLQHEFKQLKVYSIHQSCCLIFLFKTSCSGPRTGVCSCFALSYPLKHLLHTLRPSGQLGDTNGRLAPEQSNLCESPLLWCACFGRSVRDCRDIQSAW
jgi:hypothetical protein